MDKHIFSYWTVKSHVSLKDIEHAQMEDQALAVQEGREYNIEEDFDATQFCDCVYLVTPNCSELEYLVRAYVQLLKHDIYPRLRNATEELLPPDQPSWYNKALLIKDENSDDSDNDNGDTNSVGSSISKKSSKDYRRRRRSKGGHFKQLFQALGGYQTDSSSGSQGSSPDSADENSSSRTPARDKKKKKSKSLWEKTIGMISGSGLGADSEDSDEDSITLSAKRNGVEVAPNFFTGVYNDTPHNSGKSTTRPRKSVTMSGKSIADDDEAITLPAEIQLAASISELQKLALSKFSDDEDEGDETATSDDEGDDFMSHNNNALNRKLDFGVVQGSPSNPSSAKSEYQGGDEKEDKPPPPPGALRRMSNMLFGRGKLKVSSSGSGTSSGADSSSDDYDSSSGNNSSSSSSSSGNSTSSDDD